MTHKTAKELIDEHMSENGMFGDEYGPENEYMCGDTGMKFETYGAPASYSPFTGSMNFMGLGPSEAEQNKPLKPNPTPSEPSAPANKPSKGNPAPDAKGSVGATKADKKGFVTSTPSAGKVPPYKEKKPGERT